MVRGGRGDQVGRIGGIVALPALRMNERRHALQLDGLWAGFDWSC
jgi:hypothetical protein